MPPQLEASSATRYSRRCPLPALSGLAATSCGSVCTCLLSSAWSLRELNGCVDNHRCVFRVDRSVSNWYEEYLVWGKCYVIKDSLGLEVQEIRVRHFERIQTGISTTLNPWTTSKYYYAQSDSWRLHEEVARLWEQAAELRSINILCHCIREVHPQPPRGMITTVSCQVWTEQLKQAMYHLAYLHQQWQLTEQDIPATRT